MNIDFLKKFINKYIIFYFFVYFLMTFPFINNSNCVRSICVFYNRYVSLDPGNKPKSWYDTKLHQMVRFQS